MKIKIKAKWARAIERNISENGATLSVEEYLHASIIKSLLEYELITEAEARTELEPYRQKVGEG